VDERSHNRVHGIFADKCPVYRTLKTAITMITGPVGMPDPMISHPGFP
jgi:hypothetical protein